MSEATKPTPVSERMPPQGDRVLLYDDWDLEWVIGELTTLSLDDKRYQWTTEHDDYWHGYEFKRVTHWMPLPPKPEAANG